MATAPTLPEMSVEEYLRSTFEPNCEYLDGVVVSKPVPDYIHSRLQKLLLLRLAAQEQKLGIEVLAELHIPVRARRWRVPDIAGLTVRPDGRYPDTNVPPLFTVEIVSREEPWPDIRAKVTDHLSMGVSTVIIADPFNKTVMVATQSAPLHELTPPLLVNVNVPDAGVLEIDFDDLYRQF